MTSSGVAIEQGRRDAVDHVRAARSERGEAHTGPAGQLTIGLGHEDRGPFTPAEHELDSLTAGVLHELDVRIAGVTEQMADAGVGDELCHDRGSRERLGHVSILNVV